MADDTTGQPRPRGGRPPTAGVIKFTYAEHAQLERIGREPLDPLDEALILARIIAATGCTQRALAHPSGMSQGTISKRLKLLRDPQPRYYTPGLHPDPNRGEHATFADWCADNAVAAGWRVVREYRARQPDRTQYCDVDLALFAASDEPPPLATLAAGDARRARTLPRLAVEIKTRIGTEGELRKGLKQVHNYRRLLGCPTLLVTADLAPHLPREGPVRSIEEFLEELHTDR